MYSYIKYYEGIKYDFEEFLFTWEKAYGLKQGEEGRI